MVVPNASYLALLLSTRDRSKVKLHRKGSKREQWIEYPQGKNYKEAKAQEGHIHNRKNLAS